MTNINWLKPILGLFAGFLLLSLSIGPMVAQMGIVPKCFVNKLPSNKSAKTNIPAAPDLRRLFEQSMAGAVITEQQLAEERAVDAEQVEQAHIWLKATDPTQRVNGAEQLSAYPTAQAEIYLLEALNDDDDQVRAAAANSLAAFKQPSAKTYDALILAMQDSNEEVRFNAWSTLGMYLNRVELPAKTARNIQSRLAKRLKQGVFSPEIKDAVREYLRDQHDG